MFSDAEKAVVTQEDRDKAEAGHLSLLDAQREAALLQESTKQEKNSVREQAFQAIERMLNDEIPGRIEKLSEIDVNIFSGEDKFDAVELKKLAQITLEVKKKPALLAEMTNNPSHPRLLDLTDISFERMKVSQPEAFKLLLEKTDLYHEIITLVGGPEVYKPLLTVINSKATELANGVQKLSTDALKFSYLLGGARYNSLAIAVIMSDPKFAHVPSRVWGNILALDEIELREAKLREKLQS